MNTDRVHVHLRVRPELLRRVDHAAVDLGVKRSAAVEQLLEEALPLVVEPQREPALA